MLPSNARNHLSSNKLSPEDEAEYESSTERLFTTNDSQSWVDVQFYPIVFSCASTSTCLDESEEILSCAGSLDHCPSSGECQNSRADVPSYLGQIDASYRRVRTERDLDNVYNSPIHLSKFLFIRQSHSWSRLFISRGLFETLLKRCFISPILKHFVTAYGFKSEETDIGAPPLHFVACASGKSVECDMTYTLRYVELSRRANPARPWAERQTTIYNAVNSDSSLPSGSTWLFISASCSMQTVLNQFLEGAHSEQFHDPFAVHVLLLNCALSNWRPYLAYLTKDTNDRVNRVLVASVEPEGLLQLDKVEDRQRVQELGNLVMDLIVMIDSTIDTITSLLDTYQLLHPQEDMTSVKVISKNPILFALREKHRHALLIKKKAKSLSGRVQGAAQLLSSLLDLENGTALKSLALEARAEGATMRKLTEKATQDASSVKILTIITLIYLPATAVSNFFSTDFVNQTRNGDSFKVTVANNAWLLAAITIPLTAFTLSVWWLCLNCRMLGLSQKRLSDLSINVQGLLSRRKSGQEEGERFSA